ncbi:MAG: alpha/beta hydrolase [Clostridiales bacterium]|nr:alpha/beta hydrolase [Clostridiales bacterium]
MISDAGRVFGELSKRKCVENRAFAETMELHGEKILVPTRGGAREALIHRGMTSPAPTIFEIYGGCFSQGYVANNDRLRERMCRATGYNVIGLDYRKSPDDPYPAGLEDVFDAVCFFADHAEEYGIDPDRLATWGHSAGGNFACALALLAKETGRFQLRAQLLDYPYLDAWKPGIEKTASKTGLTAEVLDAMNEIYAPGELRRDAHISPVYASDEQLSGIAPAAIAVCGVDPLSTEAEAMAARLLSCGVPVMARKFMRASHGFLEHWFFREYYMDALSPEERAGIPADIGDMAEEGLAFVIGATKHFLEK